MFWDKNDLDDDWEKYRRYRAERDARDRELYKDFYAKFEYNDVERHNTHENCALGTSNTLQNQYHSSVEQEMNSYIRKREKQEGINTPQKINVKPIVYICAIIYFLLAVLIPFLT